MLRNKSIFHISTLVCLSSIFICNLHIHLPMHFSVCLKMEENQGNAHQHKFVDVIIFVPTPQKEARDNFDDRGLIPGRGGICFIFVAFTLALSPKQPGVQSEKGAVCLGLKSPDPDSDHSTFSSVGLNDGGDTSISQLPFMFSWHST
jgi:hypothetical protein